MEINSKTTQAKLIKFSPMMERKAFLKNKTFQVQKHLGWYYTVIYRPNIISKNKTAMYFKHCPVKYLIKNG